MVSARDVDDVEREMRVAERHRDGRRVSDRMRENRWRRSEKANVWARSCENDGIATKWTKIHIFCYKMLYNVYKMKLTMKHGKYLYSFHIISYLSLLPNE